MSEGNSITQNRSLLKDFLASIATIRGDLSNITAPPFVLDTKSAVELPAFWAERPSIFVAAAKENDPSRRALAVLKWFLSSLRNQQYAGHEPEEGVKKPLNAFLGEVFLARWEDGVGITRLVSEQVSHHPPVTACRVWNEDHGVYAEGFTRQEITFSGSVNIQQIGRATLRLSKHDNETYLIPLPNVKVSGILTGTPYPELGGTYYIPSTNGYISSIDFSGKSLFGTSKKKHSFQAKLYKEGQEKSPLYTISGHWDSDFTIHDVQSDKDIETFDIVAAKSTPVQIDPLEEQDPWETRLAWRNVREALNRGDMQATSDAKNQLENGQRAMRKEAHDDGESWQRIFFRDVRKDDVAAELASKIGETINPKDTEGIWLFNLDAWNSGIQKPYHGGLRPDNLHDKSSQDTKVNGVPAGLAANKESKLDGSGNQLPTDMATPHSAEQTDEPSNEARKGPSPTKSNVDQSSGEAANLESGVAGMTLKEQGAVEEMLRDRHASTS